jgi:hypothetical protein
MVFQQKNVVEKPAITHTAVLSARATKFAAGLCRVTFGVPNVTLNSKFLHVALTPSDNIRPQVHHCANCHNKQ